MLIATVSSPAEYYTLLGKILFQKEPELAQRLLSDYYPQKQPLDTDISRIQHYFSSYCAFQNIDPLEYTGRLYKSKKVEVRRLFIGAMLHIYNPQVYVQPIDQLILFHGFVRRLAGVLCQNEGNVSKMIREVITWEKNYQDFSGSVEQIVNELTKE